VSIFVKFLKPYRQIMRKWFFILLALIPILIHFYVLKEYTFDFPFEDDFRVIVKYLYLYLSQNTWQEKLNIFLLGENESFPLLQRLMVTGQYFFTGEQHIRSMLIGCNLLLVFIIYIFYKNAKNTPQYSLIIMSLIVFNTVHHEMFFRLDVASYQFFTLFLAICCMYLASQWAALNKIEKLLLLLLFILAPFGSVNGILTHVMVLGIFIFSKKYKPFLSFLFISILIFIFIYSLGSANEESAGVFENIRKYNFQLLYGYFLSVGGMFTIFQGEKGYLFGVFFGILIIASNIILILKFYKKNQLFEIFLFLFSASTLAAVVILRYNYWQIGYESVLGSRYKIYGALMCISALMLYLKNYEKPSLAVILGTFSIAFCAQVLGTVRGIHMMNHQRLMQLTEAHNINQHVLIPENNELRFVADDVQKYLEEHHAFTANSVDAHLENVLKKSDTISFKNYALSSYSDDPSLKGDWGKMAIPLHHFKIQGDFKKYKFYFARISDSNKKNIVVYLFPMTKSLIKSFIEPNTTRLSELSRDFYFGFFDLKAPYKLELYGTNTIQ
jgi:hypothetical protein